MLHEGWLAPKLTKVPRKIRAISEKQFHYIFNNKIDFKELKKLDITAKQDHIRWLRKDRFGHTIEDIKSNVGNTISYSYSYGYKKDWTLKSWVEESKKSLSKLDKIKGKGRHARKLTIGSVANFDDISESITEFFNECKTKSKVDWSILDTLVHKLNDKELKSVLEEPDANENESTASEIRAVTDNDPGSSKYVPKRKPKRKGQNMSISLQDL